jgi:hypothetical protein
MNKTIKSYIIIAGLAGLTVITAYTADVHGESFTKQVQAFMNTSIDKLKAKVKQ